MVRQPSENSDRMTRPHRVAKSLSRRHVPTLILGIGAFLISHLPGFLAHADESGSDDGTTAPNLDKKATVDEIFGALFGAKQQQQVSLPYPVIISGLNQGDVTMTPSLTPGETTVNRRAIVDLLLPFLIEEKQVELLEIGAQQETVTTNALNAMGLVATFDHTNLLLNIDVPIDMRSIVPLHIQPRFNPALQLNTVDQAKTSAIVNFAAGTQYVHTSKYIDPGFAATQLNLTAAINLRDLVLETGVRYSDTSDNALALNDTRLTKDLVDRRIRLEAGDLTVPTSGLQGNPRLLGLAGFRSFALQPYEEYRTNPSQQFELERSARVLVYINGQYIREFRLSPGRYNLTDLPLQSAAGNDIVLEIEYDSGDVDRVVFSAFYDFSLLKKGVSDFAVSIGPTAELDEGVRDYDMDNPAISAFYRKGWTDALTAGVNLQADTSLVNLGADLFYTNKYGTFGFLGGYSDHDEGSGGAITALYRWSDTDSARQMRFDLQARYQEEQYQALGGGSGNIEYDFAARLSRNFSQTQRMQISSGLRKRHSESEFEKSVSANYTWRTAYGTLGTVLRYNQVPGKAEEWSGGISFSIRLGDGYAQVSHDTRTPSSRASYSSRMDRNVGSFGWDTTYTRQSGIDDVRLGGSYIANRFEGRAEQRFSAVQEGDAFGSETTTEFSIGSALVYADGALALSRPVYDSFVIFAKNEAVKGFDIAADPKASILDTKPTYAAYSSGLGPAVVPDLNAYYVRTIEVDAPDAPPGTSLGGQALTFLPSYRSGYIVRLGDDRNVAVISVLVDQDGEPIPFAAGYAITSDGERHQMFTNRGGRFYVDGLQHGETVTMEFDSPEGATATFQVPEGEIGVMRLPDPVKIRTNTTPAPYDVTVRVMNKKGA